MPDHMMKLQVLTRAELALAQIRLQRTLMRAAWLGGAGLIGLVSLTMLDVAAFHALVPSLGPAIAAAVLALGNATIALVFVAIAQRVGKNDSEERLAQQMRNLAAAEINGDIARVKADLDAIGDGVRRVQSGVAALPGTGFAVTASILNALFKVVKRR
jgi:hypothetical protein